MLNDVCSVTEPDRLVTKLESLRFNTQPTVLGEVNRDVLSALVRPTNGQRGGPGIGLFTCRRRHGYQCIVKRSAGRV